MCDGAQHSAFSLQRFHPPIRFRTGEAAPGDEGEQQHLQRQAQPQGLPSNSKAPLTSTTACGQGMNGGTMRISTSVATKWAMPPIRNQRKTKPRANCRPRGAEEGMARSSRVVGTSARYAERRDPGFALLPQGRLCATTFFYRVLAG
jgi:hypothetical protein